VAEAAEFAWWSWVGVCGGMTARPGLGQDVAVDGAGVSILSLFINLGVMILWSVLNTTCIVCCNVCI